MGISTSPQQLAGKLAKFQKNILNAQRDGVRAGALLVTTSIRAELHVAVPGGRLSGVGAKGAALSVGFKNPTSTSNPEAVITARGPWQFIENKTRPHTIKHRRRAALAGRGFGPVATVQHPGTKGKHPWAKGVAKGVPEVVKVMDATVFKSMSEAFR